MLRICFACRSGYDAAYLMEGFLMRLAVIAFALLPVAAQAQDTTITLPTEPAAQSQSCPAGMVWNGDLNACALPVQATRPIDRMGEPGGCSSEHAAREVTS